VEVQLRHLDAVRPAGLARVTIVVDGQAVTDADWRACTQCGVAVLEQVRTDPDHRGRGYARQAVLAARARAPHCSWSTTAIGNAGAAAFWASLGDWIDTTMPRYCPHMAGSLEVPD
jgi:GNAT superfamily N-acetyltransferase